jgi:hypothetical protein
MLYRAFIGPPDVPEYRYAKAGNHIISAPWPFVFKPSIA